MATTTEPSADITAARAELDHARYLVEDWKRRGSPIVEQAELETRLAAAEARVANLIDPGAVAKKPEHHAARAAHAAMSSTQKAAASMLDKETDARFWAQTGYKVGQKLDTSNPTDRAMAKVWTDIYNKVKSEDAAGRLVLTYNHPVVEHHLDAAADAHDAATASLDAAAKAPTPEEAAAHTADAHAAAQAAATESAKAAIQQPPSVAPEVAHTAAQETTPAPIPKPHPGKAGKGRGAHPYRDPHPHTVVQITSPGMLQDLGPGGAATSPDNANDALAQMQAQNAPARAAALHDMAGTTGAPAPAQSVDHGTIADIRAHGHELAAARASNFVATALMPDHSWNVSELPSREALDSWYGTITDHPDSFLYAGVWDKTDPHNWQADGSPSNETFGSGKVIPVSVSVARPQPPPVVETKTNLGPIAAVGAVGIAGVLSIFAGRRHKKGR